MKPLVGKVRAYHVHRPCWGGTRRKGRRTRGWLIIQATDFMGRPCYTIWVKEDQ